MAKAPPKEQGKEDDCPICGLPLEYPALSRFDNKTSVCGLCGEAEGTGFLFTSHLDQDQRGFLQSRHWAEACGHWGMTPWQAHVIVISAIRGAKAGHDKRTREAFQKLRELETGKEEE